MYTVDGVPRSLACTVGPLINQVERLKKKQSLTTTQMDGLHSTASLQGSAHEKLSQN